MAIKRKKRKTLGDEEDRLSDLPDGVLHHILSFIDTIYAVRTSILSKRWAHLWTGVPSLNFNYKRFDKVDHYRNFVSKVLSLRDCSTIRCCNLVNRHITFDTRLLLERVIEYAEAHRVEQFNFTVEACAANALPSNLFACPSLTYLKLHQYNSGMDLPKLSGLGSLVTLYLEDFRISNENIEILSTCTKLKNLSLISCLVVDENLNLRIPNLANLTISRIQFLEHSLLLSTPNLISFSFEGGKPLEFIKELSCLEKLNIDFYASKEEEHYLGFINMLKKLCNAKSVTLSSGSIEVLRSCPNLRYKQSPFNRLKVLKVKKSDKRTPSINAPLHVLNYLSKDSPCAVLQI